MTLSGDLFETYINIFHKNLGSDGHFEVLKVSTSRLDQKLQHKTQNFLFPFFFNFGRKILKFMTYK